MSRKFISNFIFTSAVFSNPSTSMAGHSVRFDLVSFEDFDSLKSLTQGGGKPLGVSLVGLEGQEQSSFRHLLRNEKKSHVYV